MKRFLLAATCICALAAVSSVTLGGEGHSRPFATVAFAGHTAGSGYCVDGTPGCLPGDPTFSRAGGKLKHSHEPAAAGKDSSNGSASASGASILALALLIWFGIRL
ncbi:MAG TPA: hypothetical protein VN345_15115 [Blastocatellia bacterium]|jgi:hypothetical protein|nr:hypothetical protein [Blastocatellia bacterium]